MNDEELKNIYKESFNNLNEEPPADSWENISSKLNEELYKGLGLKKFLLKSLSAVSIIGILIGLHSDIFIKDPISNNKNIVDFNKQSEFLNYKNKEIAFQNTNKEGNLIEEKLSNKSLNIKNVKYIQSHNKPEKKKITQNSITDNSNIISNKNENNKNKGGLVVNKSGNEEGYHINKLTSLNVNFNTIYDTHLSDLKKVPGFDSTNSMDENKKKQKSNYKPGIIFGGGYYYNNTWVINQNTNEGFKNNSLSDTKSDFNGNFGIIAGYDFGGKNILLAEIELNKNQLQHYRVFTNGSFIHKKISLKYNQLKMMYKRRLTTNLNEKVLSFNVFAGAYYGQLKNAAEVVGGKSTSLNDIYKNYDAGLIAGFEYEFLENNQWVPYVNARSSYGLLNIYNGNNTKKYLSSTKNISFGINFGIKYKLN